MRLSHFFIDRPIFAGVISVVFVIIGLVSLQRLPIAQYPDIAPPVVNVTGQYPGASAEVVAATVVAPLEQQINGVERMLYISSNSTVDGRFSISVTFDLGTNLDTAQVQVQNRVAIAQPRLPADVRNIGVTVAKASPDLMMVVHLYSPDQSRDTLFISNYASVNVVDVLSRIQGVGSITVFGSRDYSMRVWLDPDRLQSLGLTANDVTTALQRQNVQVAAGILNQPPVTQPGAFQVSVQTLGRLADPDEFGSIVVKQSNDSVVRLKDVARVELAALDYGVNSYLDKYPATGLGIFQLPGSNAIDTAEKIKATMAELSKTFPAGLKYDIIYNPTDFIQQSVDAVVTTILEAVVLVVLVVILFLQTWRAAIIPIVAIPVSLIGTFFLLAAFGFSLNNLSLFGLVLAIGIVVDDAIVVVENVERNMAKGLSPREAAYRTMEEVGAALVAIALVLTAVFVPSAFITGISGQFYRQFALTIAGATIISLIVSLTLSPALCALLLKPHSESHQHGLVHVAAGSVLPRLQLELRKALARLCLGRRAAGAARRHHARRLCRRHRLRHERVPQDPDRLHSGGRRRIPHHRHAAAAGRFAGAHRRGEPEGSGAGAGDARCRACREHRRVLRRNAHQRAECRRRVRGAEAVR